MNTFADILATRPQWMMALAAQPKPGLFQLAARLAETHQIRPLVVPQAGLALLPVRESVRREVFYLGEIPLSVSQVEIVTGDGQTVQGAAQIMADDAEFANALAICDGVLANQLTGWEEVAAQVNNGQASRDRENRIRKTMLGRSRVDFSLLNEDDE